MLTIQERNGSNLPITSLTRGLDLSGSPDGAGGIGGLLARSDQITSPSDHAFSHADRNGNVTCLINAAQAKVAQFLYDPYGKIVSASGPLAQANKYQFSSKEYFSCAGLTYFGYRFYDANLQRWLNRDPIGTRSDVNAYRYARNRPVSLFDPSGLDPTDDPEPSWSGWVDIGSKLGFCPDTVMQGRYPVQYIGDGGSSASGGSNSGSAGQSNSGGGGFGNGGSGPTGNNAGEPPSGLIHTLTPPDVWVNSAPADVILGGLGWDLFGWGHQWITTSDGDSVGMGNLHGVPGDNGQTSSDVPGAPTQLVSHGKRTACKTKRIPGVDMDALRTYLKPGQRTGPWIPFCNDCNTWVRDTINNATPHNVYGMGGAALPKFFVNGTGYLSPGMPALAPLQNVVRLSDGSFRSPGRNLSR